MMQQMELAARGLNAPPEAAQRAGAEESGWESLEEKGRKREQRNRDAVPTSPRTGMGTLTITI